MESFISFYTSIGGKGNLSFTPFLTSEYVLNNLNYEWKWDRIYHLLPLEFIAENIEKFWWCSHHIAKIAPLSFILDNLFFFECDWGIITLREDISIEDILKSDIPFFCNVSISMRKDVTLSLVLSSPSKFNFYHLSSNPAINARDIFSHPELEWVFEEVMLNPTLTLSIVMENPQISWDWKRLACNPNFDIETLPYLPETIALSRKIPKEMFHLFKVEYLSLNPRIGWEDILNSSIEWNWNSLSMRDDINEELIENNPERKWNGVHLSRNKNISLTFALRHPEINWDFSVFSSNEGLCFSDVSENPHLDWNLNQILCNPFRGERRKNKFEELKKRIASNLIKRWWLHNFWNPYSKIGEKRIIRSWGGGRL